jgi:hypothetical protein
MCDLIRELRKPEPAPEKPVFIYDPTKPLTLMNTKEE